MNKPTYKELAAAYIELRTAAQIVSDHFQGSPAGDCFEWIGGMNDVEMLRREIDITEYDEKFQQLIYGEDEES